MERRKILTIQQVEDITITVYQGRKENHLEFKLPRCYNGREFDEWWHRHHELIGQLKRTKKWDVSEL